MPLLGVVKKNTEHGRSKKQTRSSLQLPSVATAVVVAAAAAAVLLIFISIYINLPWVQVFWLDVVPSFWRLLCGTFTPGNLFIVLNALILSVLALAHLQSKSTSFGPRQPSSSQPGARNHSVDHDQMPIHTDRHDNQSGSKKLKVYDDGIDDGEQTSSADDFSFNIKVKNGEPHGGATLLCQPKQYIQREVDSEEEERGAATESKKSKKGTSAEAAAAGQFKEEEGDVNVDGAFIDSLLAEKASIFAQAQHRDSPRPLASAHFTRKKGPPPHDRPLSPLKTILKRGDTLEATWKAICESKRHSSPLNRHHPKHEPHAHHHPRAKPRASSPSPLSPIKQRHKATIKNMLHCDDELPRRLPRRREPSISQEELNAKVESFISKFNAQIKIQREKSLLDYMEMVGRGAS